MTGKPRFTSAFTLVELLITVAILVVLATLAIFNMGEAQTRAKLARAKADIRTIAVALESYRADHNAYPLAATGDEILESPLNALTVAPAYLTSVPTDAFGRAHFVFSPEISMLGYNYKDAASTSRGLPAETYGAIWRQMPNKKYILHSCGPNQRWDVMPYIEYDPSNGTRSNGDICMLGP